MSDKAASPRDSIRAQVFQSRQPKRKEIEFFGAKIELSQPTLGAVLDAANDEARQEAIIDTLVKYAYVPGTNERVFEDTDADSFKLMPWGVDFQRVAKALEEITDLNFLDTKAS